MLLNLLWLHYVGVVVIVAVEVECDLMANYFLSCVQNKFRFFNPRNERKKRVLDYIIVNKEKWKF